MTKKNRPVKRPMYGNIVRRVLGGRKVSGILENYISPERIKNIKERTMTDTERFKKKFQRKRG